MHSTENSKDCLFLNSASEVERLLNSHSEILTSNVLVVALTADADYACEKLGVSHKTIEDFYADETLMEQGISNYARVEEFCLELEKLLRDNSGYKVETISPFDSFYLFKAIFDTFLHRATALDLAIKKISPQTIYSFSPGKIMGRTAGEWLVAGDLSLVILPSLCRKAGLSHLILGEKLGPFKLGIADQIFARLRAFRRGAGTFLNLVRAAGVRKDTINFTKKTLIFDEDKVSLFPKLTEIWKAQGGSVITSVDALSALNFFDFFEILKSVLLISFRYRIARKNIFHTEVFQRLATVAGIDYSSFLKSIVLNILFENLWPAQIRFEAYRVVLKKFAGSSRAILSIGDRSFARAARKNKIPTFYMQHGGGYGYCHFPMFEYSAFYEVDRVVVGGVSVENFFKKNYPYFPRRALSHKAPAVSTGLPALDDLVAKRRTPVSSKMRLKAVYGITNLSGDHRYFNYNALPDIAYWKLNRKVAEIFSEYSDIDLVIKLPPQDALRKEIARNPLSEWLRDSKITNVTTESQTPFYELMQDADLLIMDIPSTMLLQAVTTTAPIIIMSDPGWIRMTPEARNLLSKRAKISDSVAEFLSDIQAFLDSPLKHSKESAPNDEFLRHFGTFLGDGKSLDRVVDLLNKA